MCAILDVNRAHQVLSSSPSEPKDPLTKWVEDGHDRLIVEEFCLHPLRLPVRPVLPSECHRCADLHQHPHACLEGLRDYAEAQRAIPVCRYLPGPVLARPVAGQSPGLENSKHSNNIENTHGKLECAMPRLDVQAVGTSPFPCRRRRSCR